nr:type III-B CRISPR module-associated Cmr3 family protein [Candidatus Freyarchaeota archaeon]
MNSSETLSLAFRIIEPMMFRGPGEFDPSARGAQSHASSLDIPSPSTIAGAIATHTLNIGASKVKNFQIQDWVEQSLDVLGSNIRIKGPLILSKGEIMVDDRVGGGFLKLNEVKEKCTKIYGKLNYKVDSLDKLYDIMSFGKKSKPAYKSIKNERVGVGLVQRSKSIKMANEELGLLYSAQYIDYPKKEEKTINAMEVAIEIIGDVKNTTKLTPTNNKPTKLGGEGRVALLNVSKTAIILEEIRKTLWNEKTKHKGHLACYLATPALFKGNKTVDKYINEWAEKLNSTLVANYGETDILGAGFSIYHQKRKPIYSSLKAGSVIFLEGSFNLDELYWESDLGEASRLGYGTLLPVIF